jgi:hypothetical protein
MSLDQGSVTLIAAGFGVSGVLLGHYLTRSWQREQWRLDRRGEEYRQLITALSDVFTNMQRSGMYMGDHDRALKLEIIKARAYRVIRDRILIAEELGDANILERWARAFGPVDNFSHNDQTWGKFADEYVAINDALVKLALAPPPHLWARRLKKLRSRFSRSKSS